jgi:hypothetical protein
MILATRLPFKMHLHFPNLVVDRDTALEISTELSRRFSSHPFYTKTAVDISVYNTGLRLLWCHKGAMGTEGR